MPRIKDCDQYLRDRIKVDPETRCWNWTGKIERSGYGRWGGKGIAHRKSFELHRGPIPTGLWVLHHCDNKRCVNPEHLFTGTSADNARDRANKGRSMRGERHVRAKFSETQVREIKASKERTSVLARRYGVRSSAISNIRSGYCWGWL